MRVSQYSRFLHYCLTCLAMMSSQVASGAVVGGRPPDQLGLSTRVMLRGGRITSLKGVVKETTRPIFELEQLQYKYKYREDYSLEELGLDQSFTTIGLELEHRWRYLTLNLTAYYANPQASGTAPRDFYIGVEDVEYAGRSYEYLMIPAGQAYDADIQGGMVSASLRWTPLSLAASRVTITPWIQGGLFSLFGRYQLDAGPAQGLTTYENPPQTYVVGGEGTGWAGMVIPEAGIGAESGIVLARRSAGDVKLVLAGEYSLLEFDGSTGDMGVGARHEKDVDLSYRNYGGRVELHWPVNTALHVLAGIEYRRVEADASITAQERSAEEVREFREKYDKEVDFEMTWVTGFVGVVF